MVPTAIIEPESPHISRGLVLVFAVACGLSVANLYYAQPVLAVMAHTFHTSAGVAGLLVTASQVGYALGLAFIVPLGDLLVRRRLVPALLALVGVCLAVCAAAPDLIVLGVFLLLVGIGTCAAQIIVPLAASLAHARHRGEVVGTVMSGLLLGILLARTVSGVLAQLTSWRVVYAIAAVVVVATAAVLTRAIPPETSRPQLHYRALLRSSVEMFRSEPVLRRRCLYGALGFAAFSVFWTTLAFLLSAAPYRYGDAVIGLFGLVGAAGALCANLAGRWADRGLTRHTTLCFAAAMAVAFAAMWAGGHVLVVLIAGVIVLDVGVQGMQITNQSVIYALAPEARSRINSAYMVCYFAGGAIGSALGSVAYSLAGWAGACALGLTVSLAAVLMAVAEHRRWFRLRTAA